MAVAGSAVLALVLAIPAPAARAAASIAAPAGALPTPRVARVFQDAAIRFLPDSAWKAARAAGAAEENGRTVRATVSLPETRGPVRVTAVVRVRPVAKTEREVHDRYDRAGNVRLVTPGAPDLEVVRFVTPYGGPAEYEVDVTPLAPLLRGRRTFRAHIDTWSDPAWRLDFELRYQAVKEFDNATWAAPAYYAANFNRQDMPAGDSAVVEIPRGLRRVVLEVTSTGHCTDGRDEDEFVSKANVISVDGVVVARYHPWRDDCRRFRDRNPYCARWTDGTWSSDYSRSGWCPGVEVPPVEFDLTDHLAPGPHVIRFAIENMRPKDTDGNYGYWRVSAHLVGWDRSPRLWLNP